jgi:hypothetical protein
MSKVSFDEIARSSSGKQLSVKELENFRKKQNKNVIVLNPSLGPTQVPWSGSTAEEYTWPSQDPANTQSRNEKRDAQNEASYETDLRGKWNITEVKDDGSEATLCNTITKVCIVVGLAAGALAKLSGAMGGKTRHKKRRQRKTRRHRKK